MIGTDDHLIARIIVKALNEVVYVVCFHHTSWVLFSNQPAADLAAIAIQLLQIVANASVQPSYFCDLRPLLNAGIRIWYCIVALFFKCSLAEPEKILAGNAEIIFYVFPDPVYVNGNWIPSSLSTLRTKFSIRLLAFSAARSFALTFAMVSHWKVLRSIYASTYVKPSLSVFFRLFRNCWCAFFCTLNNHIYISSYRCT